MKFSTRPYRPSFEIQYRLEQWRAGCRRGLLTAEIAHQLRISVPTLQRSVYYARKRGHPDAVLHPLTPDTSDDGLKHLWNAQARRRRTARRAGDGSGPDLTHGTLPETTDDDT